MSGLGRAQGRNSSKDGFLGRGAGGETPARSSALEMLAVIHRRKRWRASPIRVGLVDGGAGGERSLLLRVIKRRYVLMVRSGATLPTQHQSKREMQRESAASPLPRCVVLQHTSCGNPYRYGIHTGVIHLAC